MLFLAESKIDGTLCDAQFTVDNYHFWRKDRTTHGGRLAVYVRSDLPCDRKNKLEFQCIESFSVEIKIGSDKSLITGVYRPQTINEKILIMISSKHVIKLQQNMIILCF